MKNEEKIENQNSDNVSHHIPWWVWFIIAMIIGGIGGYLMGSSVQYNYLGVQHDWDRYYGGLFVLLCSIPFDILGLKALIIEAHVKALEVFYGKKRAVKFFNISETPVDDE